MPEKITTRIGFSLVELMAVVTVIGILVALALPRFRTFIARSRQAEAINNLGIIHKLQKSYNLRYSGFGADGVYHGGLKMGLGGIGGTCGSGLAGTRNTLGFRVEDCDKLRYTYSTIFTTGGYGGGGQADNNNPAGRQIYPNCSETPVGGMSALTSVAGCFGAPATGSCLSADIDRNGVINLFDLVQAAQTLGSGADGLDYWSIDRGGGLANPSDVVAGCAD